MHSKFSFYPPPTTLLFIQAGFYSHTLLPAADLTSHKYANLCCSARVDIFHTNICLNSQNREKRRLVEVLNTTEAGNKWVTHTIDENVEESNSLCMCGEKLPPEIVYRIENTWCALSGCRFNKRYMRTPEQKADGKLEFQILMRVSTYLAPLYGLD